MRDFLRLDNLCSGYDHSLHQPLSLTIHKPGIYLISGPNGSGKTTLIRTLLNLLNPISGSFEYSEQNSLSYVSQVSHLHSYFPMNISRYVSLGLGPSRGLNQDKIPKILEHWEITHLAQRSLQEISPGEKLRAMMARAMVSQPKGLFLDEPLAHLDVCCQEFLVKTIQDYALQNNAFIFVIEHHFEKFSEYVTGNITFGRWLHGEALSQIQFQQVKS